MGVGGNSHHLPIFLEYRNGPIKPPSPMKFNKTWLKDDSFRMLITNHWAHYAPDSRLSTTFQFAVNFHNIKASIKSWSANKRCKEDCELKLIEQEIVETLEKEGEVC